MKSPVNNTESEKRRLKSGSWEKQCLQNAPWRRRSRRSLRKNSQRKQEVSYDLSEPGSPRCSRTSDFSEKFVIYWSSPTCLYPSPLPPPTPYHLSFPLSSKQTPVATIKNKYNNTTFSFHRCRPFLHPLQAKIPKALATLSPLPHFSLTLSPLQAEHPLQMFQQSHQCPPRY